MTVEARLERPHKRARTESSPCAPLQSLRKLVAAANRVKCLEADLPKQPSTAVTLALEWAQDLPRDTKQALFELERTNMRDIYDAGAGWDGQAKWKEMFSPKARYIICSTHIDDSNDSQSIVGFCHFHFLVDTDGEAPAAVVYVYELQVAKTARRQGLGLRMLRLAEAVADQHSMAKIMLTVFKRNSSAVKFYLETAGFQIDASSPSLCDREEDFEILSKQIVQDIDSTNTH